MKLKTPFFLAAGALALGVPVWAQSARICFEAEKPGAIQSPLKNVTGQNAKKVSGGGFLDIPWDENKTKGIGSATYKINAPKAGVYYVWARTFWANGCGNSIEVVVNGGSPLILGEDGTYDAWHWVGGRARVALKAGANTLVLKNRETGVRVDQFFLTQDANYTPTNLRKVTQ